MKVVRVTLIDNRMYLNQSIIYFWFGGYLVNRLRDIIDIILNFDYDVIIFFHFRPDQIDFFNLILQLLIMTSSLFNFLAWVYFPLELDRFFIFLLELYKIFSAQVRFLIFFLFLFINILFFFIGNISRNMQSLFNTWNNLLLYIKYKISYIQQQFAIYSFIR